MNTTQELISFLANFYSDSEKDILYNNECHNYCQDDCKITDLEYYNLAQLYNNLLSDELKEKYRIELGPTCTFLINELFKRYVTDNTFVLTTEQEHPAVKACLTTKSVYILLVDDIKKKDVITQIINTYKNSKCTNFFLMMSGVIPGTEEIIDEMFFKKLKHALTQENIPHILALDDCQGIFMNKRDYSPFDCVLGTAHVLVKDNYDLGILFTKLKHKIGYINKAGLKNFYNKLNIVLQHKEKALQFNDIMQNFFKDIIDGDSISIGNNLAKQHFVLHTNGLKFYQKYAEEFYKTNNICFSELNLKNGLIRIRYHEAICFNPEKYVNDLMKFKQFLMKLQRFRDLRIYSNFNNDINIKYDFIEKNPNKQIGQINQNQRVSSFYIESTEKQIEMEKISKQFIENSKFLYHYIYPAQKTR